MPTIKQHIKHIEKEGHETSFMTGYKDEAWSKAELVELKCIGKKGTYRLFHLEGWKKYSRKCVHFAQFSYLSGYEDRQIWTIRIPGNIENINQAIEWVKPAAVKNAEKSGKKVLRQGDIFIVPTAKKTSADFPFSHRYIKSLKTVVHPQHGPLKIPFAHFKTVPVKSVSGTMTD